MTDTTYKPEWEWPCWKRKAHGPHMVENRRTLKAHECPGVKAHPATMIGGKHSEEAPEANSA